MAEDPALVAELERLLRESRAQQAELRAALLAAAALVEARRTT